MLGVKTKVIEYGKEEVDSIGEDMKLFSGKCRPAAPRGIARRGE